MAKEKLIKIFRVVKSISDNGVLRQAKITKRIWDVLKIIQKWLLKKDITAAFINGTIKII